MNIGIIGGADGPTSIYLAGELGWNWLNIFGIIIVVLMRIPNIIYAIRFPGQKNKSENQVMNILEQAGKYVSMFLMIFNIGIGEMGFSSLGLFFAYFLGNGILLLAYWIVWILFFVKPANWKRIVLAIIPTGIFLLSGLTLENILLIISALIFGSAHIYCTYKNFKEVSDEP